MELMQTIKKRKSVKKFKTKKPDWRDIIECIDATRYAPMTGNNFTLKFVIIKNKETIQKLADASQQPFITQAHYVVVVCSNPTRTLNMFEERGKKYLKQQAGAAIENFLLKIEEKGLATTWVGHFVDYLVKEAINIPSNIEVEALFPIGYESNPKTSKKRKIDLDNILYFEKYGNKKMKSPRIVKD